MTERIVTGCNGKKRYESFRAADYAARRLRQKVDESHVAAYHCRHCNGSHVGEARSHGKRNPRKDVPK